MTIDVSIIIVNHKTRDLLIRCLESIISNTENIDYEIIVIDSGSCDDSIPYAIKHFEAVKNIRFIPISENVGFARANNIALGDIDSKYFFFLNPDTLLQNNAVRLFYDFLENSDPAIGAAGTNLSDQEGNPQLSYGCFPSLREEFFFFGRNLFLFGKNKVPSGIASADYQGPADYISGADLFVRSSCMKEVGKFDESFFLYFEETDWCKRSVNMGFRNFIITGPAIIHLREASPSGDTLQRLEIYHKSKRHFFRKHYGAISLVILRILTFGIYMKSGIGKMNVDHIRFSIRQLIQK